MIEQFFSNGGQLAVIVIAVVLLYREVMRGQAIREIKKNGGTMNGLYTIDPRTAEPILLPALNFRILNELIAAEAGQTEALREIAGLIRAHDEPIIETAAHCKAMDEKLMTPSDLGRMVEEAARKGIAKEFDVR